MFVAGSFHPEIGGPPRYLDALARELVQRGHEVRVVCMSPAGSQPPASDYPYLVKRISRAWPVPLRLALMLTSILRHGARANLIFISDYGVPPVLANILLRKPTLIKIVGDFAWEWARRHGKTEEDFDSFQVSKQTGKVRLVQMLQRFYVRRCRRVLVPSHYLKGIVTGWGVPPDRIEVVHNAVEESRYHLPDTPEEARQLLDLPERYFVTVARLAPWKGVDHLIDALPHLPEDLALVVVGDGPERGELEARAERLGVKGRVRFAGAVSGPEVGVYLRGAKFLALYTGYEGLSHVLLEALLAGIPIVASEKGGNVEVVEHEVSGLLVPYGDIDALRSALSRLGSDETLRSTLAEGAASRQHEFSWPELTSRTIGLIEETAGVSP